MLELPRSMPMTLKRSVSALMRRAVRLPGGNGGGGKCWVLGWPKARPTTWRCHHSTKAFGKNELGRGTYASLSILLEAIATKDSQSLWAVVNGLKVLLVNGGWGGEKNKGKGTELWQSRDGLSLVGRSLATVL